MKAFKNPVSYFGCGVFCCLIVNPVVQATPPIPFYTRDLNPLIMPYGLPLPTPARLLAPQQQSFNFSFNASNTINVYETENEILFVDAESYQINLIQDWGFEDWMLRIQLPLISHGPGFLDNWIDTYHDIMQLPGDARPLYPQDEFIIAYKTNDNTLFYLDERSNGIGDIAIQAALASHQREDFALSYWISLELPTGDSVRLTGSNSVDLAFWLAMDQGFKYEHWIYANTGILLMTEGDILPEQQNHAVLFGNLGAQFHPWQMIILKAQLDIHTPFYDIDSKFLKSIIQFSFGGSLLLSKQHRIDIAVSEDVRQGASPDVSFNITWQILFNR